MTTLRRRRALVPALVLALLFLTIPYASDGRLPELPPVAEVVGSVPYPALACVGCIGGGVLISMGGWAGILGASMRPGSAGVVGACIYACHRALTR
jgi:hypothetical protein